MTFQPFSRTLSDGTVMAAGEWTAGGTNERGATERTEAQAPSAVVLLVHGMGEHMGRYDHVAAMLNEAGYAALGFDQRGHGRTAGKRGHTPSYEGLLEGVNLLFAEAARRYPGVPVILYGHSMGGNVALNYLLRRKPNVVGAVIGSPWLRLAFAPPQAQVVIGRLVERLYPGFTNKRPMKVEHLTTDPAMAERYRSDPLGHGHITARFFFGVQRAGPWAIQHADELSVPTLLMHGDDDRVTSVAASRQFAERAGPLCDYREWHGYKHELHNELAREPVLAAIRDWIAKRLADEKRKKALNR
ncbi:Lysophospholipase, alpha-beta hydrolase superfamily [Cohnella sp. OV330]|uniref:alpha/beta hydrolase n=1 Tax=Cohnella sp. OV330 TaxID=1855288 RepID=UPI0008F41E8B|nr:alpha/beta hydrolase [Cohnella sp. OV330]SFB09762.1 Lysophospholipase, alpha-beta hydrolase superfamily [Cohnella sp. OV330]